MSEPLVSIVIPAYNADAFIERSIGCALGQSVHDVEVVVVDDGSSDETVAIVERIAQRDSRVKLVKHEQNRKRLEARRTGIANATAPFILFLDADDELREDAAERLLEAQEGRFDIVQCSFEMRYDAYVSDADRRFDYAFNRAPSTTCEGDAITHLVFRERKTTWSLCGKLMRTSLLTEAMGFIDGSSISQAEDACIFFIVSCLAQTYRGIGGYEGYIYNIDQGGSDARWKVMDLEKFSFSCRYVDAMDRIRTFLEETGRLEALQDDYETVRYEHVRAVADKLIRYVTPEVRPAAYDEFLRAWPAEEAIAGMSEAGWNEAADCVESVAGATSLTCPPHEVRTIAAYHYRMGIGGAERVAAELACTWHDQGLRVVFFADEPRECCAFDLPDDVIWIELPAAASMRPGGYGKRARLIAQAISDYGIDAFVYHQWWSATLAWDMLLAKSLGVPFCVYCHSTFKIMFCEPTIREIECPRILRHADGLIVLSEADRVFWSAFNPRVWKSCNPLTAEPDATWHASHSSAEAKNVVWVGRLSSFDKQPQEALEIMARVVSQVPDCTLSLVGPAPSRRALIELKALARRLGIERNVEFVGGNVDTEQYYRRASVHLLTSRLDGWCLVLVESKAVGVPCVMYEMDYLTLAEGRRGIVAVAQGDRDGAAREIVDLLSDAERRDELGREALAHAQELAAFDLATFWRQVIDELAQGSAERRGFEQSDLTWNLALDGFKDAVGKALDLPVASYAKRKGLKTARAIWHRFR